MAARRPATKVAPADWQAMLRYPLVGEALLTILLLASLRVVASFLPFLGWILDIVISVALFKYAADVLAKSAHGQQEPPGGIDVPDRVGWTVMMVQVLLVAVAAIAALLLRRHGHGDIEWIPWLVVAFAMPAVLSSAAIDGDPWEALNPVLWWRASERLGLSYLVAMILCYLATTLRWEAVSIAGALPLAWPIAYFLVVAVSFHATLLSFRYLGDVIHRHRERLHFEPPPAAAPVLRPKPKDEVLLARVAELEKAGDAAGARAAIEADISERGVGDPVHAAYRRLLTAEGDQEALRRHTHQWLGVLVANERWDEALAFWAEQREAEPDLWPGDPELVEQLCARAHGKGRADWVELYANGFRKAHPKHPAVPVVHLWVARAWLDAGRDREQVIRLLEATWLAYPRARCREQLGELLTRLGAPPAAAD
jgi:hypothetical protein